MGGEVEEKDRMEEFCPPSSKTEAVTTRPCDAPFGLARDCDLQPQQSMGMSIFVYPPSLVEKEGGSCREGVFDASSSVSLLFLLSSSSISPPPPSLPSPGPLCIPQSHRAPS